METSRHRGNNRRLAVQVDHPLRNRQLTLDDGKQITLSGGEGNLYKGSILMQKDGAYHVSALDHGQPVRLSEDYFIATDKANPPRSPSTGLPALPRQSH